MKILDYIEEEKRRLGSDEYNQKIFSEQMMGLRVDRQGYISKVARFEVIPSLMMALVLEILSDGRIRPRDLVTAEQLEAHFLKRDISFPDNQTFKKFQQE